jgi:hypothetical protein
MMALPVIVNERCYDLFIILQDDNIERMKAYDPAELITANFAERFTDRNIRTIVMMYGTKADISRFTTMCQAGDVRGALRYLARGFKFRPEAGDEDVTGGYDSALENPP